MTDSIEPHGNDVTNVHQFLGVRHVLVTGDKAVLEVDVDQRLHQPYGILHGGVSALLAEGAASLGGGASVDEGFTVVGTELNCSHLRPVTGGLLRATATPIRKGRTVQVWAIEITDERERLISVARCSMQVIATPARRP